MVLVKYLISIFIIHSVIASTQINLDVTDWADQNIVLQHSCLHAATSTRESHSREILSYCIDEWPSKWEIDVNTLDPAFTFSELYRMNVTSENLYHWSGPMNVIQWYQFYLNQMAISNVSSSSLATQIFYNCTSPRFGPQCQYSLDAYQSHHSSLNEIIEDHYLQVSEPDTLTCYIHLQCNRGGSLICLDWSEICDGKVDCIDGRDEENCFLLMNNKCADDEYRCDNGQCIPKTFFNDGSNNFDCLDRSDEPQNRFEHFQSAHDKPTLVNENAICSWRDNLHNDFMGPSLTSSCMTSRQWILEQAMFSNRSNTVSADCLLAFKCLHNIPNFNNPLCSNFCEDQQCIELIENNCPDLLFVPLDPIAYGHIYLVFSKESAVDNTYPTRIPPTYICYNEKLCGEFLSNKTLLSINGLTCRRPEDFPIVFTDPSGESYFSYLKPLFSKLSSCNSITNGQLMICNGSHVYQCKNSSKCIPRLYVGDGIQDCAYNDDEEQATFDELCMTDQSNLFFKCQTTNRCIRRDQVEDSLCDCQLDGYGMCDDENLHLNEIRRTITFSNICNGFVDLLPVFIDGQIETDETNCEYWPCNNTYTRCDDYWNCLDGSDEINCDPSPLVKCPPYHHVCVSPLTNQLMCLSIEKANDGYIDCLGGTDEPSLCPVTNDQYFKEKKFYCHRGEMPSCIEPLLLCDGTIDCENADDERFCGNMSHLTPNDPANTDAQNFFYAYFYPSPKSKSAHFPLAKSKPNVMTSRSLTIKQSGQDCQRGLPLRVWLSIINNLSTTTCLCPPSYYGDQCQYQNQRVSLTMQLNAMASAKRTLFTLVISLVDDSSERIIHSYQQMTYIYVRDENTKFNFYLLYSTRPKDTRKNYAIHIDIYEKMTLNYRGSFLISLKFPFLPVERVAVKFTLPQISDRIPTCDNSQCIHGQCTQYINDPKNIIFCRCNPGWTGKYCNIPYMCTCSLNSLCVGVDANNRSICVCPSDKFGAQCLLDNQMRQLHSYSRCYNGGICLPADEHTIANESCYCLCPKGFSGNKCEIPDTKIILSFDKDIVSSLPSFLSLHFIDLNDSTAPVDDTSWQIICSNGTTAISYWSRPFHIAFVQLIEPTFPYYLIGDHHSSDIIRTITPIDRCRSSNEIFDERMIQKPLLQRIKHYPLLCQNRSLNLSCFYDEIHMCICQGDQRFANCFKFDHQMKFDDFDMDNNKIESECPSDYTFNLSTSTAASRTSSPSSTRPTTSGISSIHTCEYCFYAFILLIYSLRTLNGF